MPANTKSVSAQSVLGDIAKRRAAYQEKHHVDLEIPGEIAGGALYGRFRPVKYVEFRNVQGKYEDLTEGEQELSTGEDVIALTLIEFLVKVEGELQPVDSTTPARWLEVAPLVGIDPTDETRDSGNKTQKEILRELVPEDLLIMQLFGQAQSWQYGIDQEVDENLAKS